MSKQAEQAREHFLEGIGHFEAGRLDAAQSSFRTALELAPERVSVLGNLGITLFHLKRWDEAIPILQQATERDPAYAEAWLCLGLSHEAIGKLESAVPALERGLAGNGHAAWPWLVLGRSLARLGQFDKALRAVEQALDIDDGLADAWSTLGSILRDLNRLDEAAACFEKVIDLGLDPELHRYFLNAVRGHERPASPPRHFVETLFDEYSTDFDNHLVEQLGYRGHERLLQPVIAQGRRYRSVLDLGCGTGLCGSLLAPFADFIDGVDISSAMLEKARARGVYRNLVHDDLTHFLATERSSHDLVLAADVFIYVGALESVFAAVRRLLAPGGCFAFTLELGAENEDFRLLPSLRYAHSESYIRRLAAEHGFTVRDLRAQALREDHKEPVDALYVYLD